MTQELVRIHDIVICGRCFGSIDIEEWWNRFPHPNRSHTCNNCGFLWEPIIIHQENGLPWGKGSLVLADMSMVDNQQYLDYTIDGISFFHACGEDYLH